MTADIRQPISVGDDDDDAAAAAAAREAALDEELAAAGLRIYDELLDGMREGRYGGRPLHGRGPAALVLLLHLLEWRGDARGFAAALPHFPDEFGVAEARETLWRLGFTSRVRRLTWARALASEAPALIEMRGGRLCVMIVDGAGRRLAIDPTTGERQSIGLAERVRVVRFTPRDDVGSAGAVVRLAQFFGDHRRDIGVLFGVATMINALVIVAALGVRSIYDLVIPARGYDTLVAIGAGVAMALAIDLLLRGLRARIIAHISARVATRVGALLFDVLIHLPLERLKGAPLSAQINRIRQFEGLLTTLTGPVTTLAVETPFFLAMTLALYIVAGPLALIPVCVLVAHVVVAVVLLPGQRRREEEHQIRRTRFQNLMIESALNAQVLRSYGVRDVWSARLERAADSVAVARRRSTARQRMVFAVANAANPAAIAATAALGAAAVIDGRLTVGELVAATMLVGRALAPLHQGFTTVWTATDLRATWSQVDRMLQVHAPRREPPAPVRRLFVGAMTLQRLSFRYAGSAETALSGLDLKIPAGAFVALTGTSGSGKSTLLRVLSGLSEPQAGTVFIDDVNIRQIPQAELRAVVGYAPDSPQLFHGTIAQNLRLAAPTACDGELSAICGELGLERWIDALPDGIDTRLDHETRGLLPAGFRQTLATAQALLGDPRVLLLDQPATALDPVLEAAMIAALTRRRGALTIVMVTHRPSHVRAADLELRLQNGRALRLGPVDMQKEGAP